METTKQDVIIIGAGIIGLVTAYELARKGASVTILDDHEPGWAASRGNAGMIYPGAGEPMVNPHHMKAGINWVLTRGGESPLQFNLFKLPSLIGWGLKAMGVCKQENYERGKEAFQEFGADVLPKFAAYKADGIDYEEHPGGFMATFIDDKEFHRQTDPYLDVPAIEVMSGDQAREREPLLSRNVVGAAQLPGEIFTSVYPPDVCRKFARRLKEMGVQIKTGVRVTGARRNGRTVKSLRTTATGNFQADHFVVAAGGWSGNVARMLGSRVSITGGKGYALTLDDPSDSPTQSIFMTEYESVAIPFDGKLRFTGFLDLDGVSMKVYARRIRALRKIAGRYLHQVPQGTAEEHWTGMRALSPDGLPIVGKLPKLDNAWIGSGHWHFGLTLAPPTAVMLTDLIMTGQSSMNTEPFDPGRI